MLDDCYEVVVRNEFLKSKVKNVDILPIEKLTSKYFLLIPIREETPSSSEC